MCGQRFAVLWWFFLGGGEGGSIKLNAGCASRLVKRTLDLAVTATIIQLCV